MFAKKSHTESFSKYRTTKASSRSKRSFREHAVATRKSEKPRKPESPSTKSNLTSPIVTISVGPDQRLFAAHEEVLSTSPFFAARCLGQYIDANSRRINLPEEVPEVFSSVLEFLYKGDYYPRLLFNKRRNAWELESLTETNTGRGPAESTVSHKDYDQALLKDTLLYCAADQYGLDELKRIALRKQGLQTGIQCGTILASARYAYAHTPDNDSKLRGHYLTLIMRSRSTFKRSGTMQMEMERGGRLFFDLFVTMCNHLDDITSATKSPKSIR